MRVVPKPATLRASTRRACAHAVGRKRDTRATARGERPRATRANEPTESVAAANTRKA
ncbi:hypothetical protein AZ78_0675 [Lysobacter capsici AZ78]|uniref:Uncharacterized protein n=1 Tax=Lysobacter capsici AZ78 TaxID=1444315 RepID=A0A108U5X0_9GAMM|nr:hypothetical protein AZ78_0675 [Lysobacter capsici AZ78]